VLNRNRQGPAETTAAFGPIAERFRRAGDPQRAVALCREGLARFPNHLSGRVTLGWALLDLGHYEEARAELEQVLRRAPDNLAAIRGLAELHDRAENTLVMPMDGAGAWPLHEERPALPEAAEADAAEAADEEPVAQDALGEAELAPSLSDGTGVELSEPVPVAEPVIDEPVEPAPGLTGMEYEEPLAAVGLTARGAGAGPDSPELVSAAQAAMENAWATPTGDWLPDLTSETPAPIAERLEIGPTLDLDGSLDLESAAAEVIGLDAGVPETAEPEVELEAQPDVALEQALAELGEPLASGEAAASAAEVAPAPDAAIEAPAALDLTEGETLPAFTLAAGESAPALDLELSDEAEAASDESGNELVLELGGSDLGDLDSAAAALAEPDLVAAAAPADPSDADVELATGMDELPDESEWTPPAAEPAEQAPVAELAEADDPVPAAGVIAAAHFVSDEADSMEDAAEGWMPQADEAFAVPDFVLTAGSSPEPESDEPPHATTEPDDDWTPPAVELPLLAFEPEPEAEPLGPHAALVAALETGFDAAPELGIDAFGPLEELEEEETPAAELPPAELRPAMGELVDLPLIGDEPAAEPLEDLPLVGSPVLHVGRPEPQAVPISLLAGPEADAGGSVLLQPASETSRAATVAISTARQTRIDGLERLLRRVKARKDALRAQSVA
jgi:hypothetical protein